MRKRKLPSNMRTFGRFQRHVRRVNPWHDRQECERIARAQYWYMVADYPALQRRFERVRARLNAQRCIARDTLVIAFVPGRRWPDGEVSQDQWTAAVLHRNPHGPGRTTYVGGKTRAEALEMFERHHGE